MVGSLACMETNLFAPMTQVDHDLASVRRAPGSVQASLYQRLRKTWGLRAGHIAWAVVRAGQDYHEGHAVAVAQLGNASASQLAEIISVVRATKAKPKNDICRDLCADILDALKELYNTKAAEEGAE